MVEQRKTFFDLILLKGLKVTDVNKRKTYIFFFTLIITIGFRIFFSDFIKETILIIIIDLLLLFFGLNIIAHIIKIILISSYRKRKKLPADHRDNLTIGLSSLIYILMYFSFIIGLFFYFNVEIISFLTVFGLFFAGLMWVFKEHIVNVVNGLIIMFSKNLSIGDYIWMDNYKGIIRNITFLYTEIKTDEGNLTYIPNNLILSREVINYSKTNLKRIMFNFDLASIYFKKFSKIEMSLLKEVEKEFPDIVREMDIRIGKLKAKSANLIIEISVSRYNFSVEKKLKDFIKRKIIEFES